VIGGVVGLQFGLTTCGAPGWPCPFKALFGIPCPGCGLSTAVAQLLHGHWQAAMATHAFAPLFLAATALILVVGILPEAQRMRAVELVTSIEKRTGVTMLIMIALFLYWGFRLLWF